MDDTIITECVAIASGGGRAQGGALYTTDASATVALTTISNCTATTAGADSFGGAMEIYGGSLTLDDSTITACVASTSGDDNAYGGAVYTREASTSLTNTTISDCTALASGGGPSYGGAMMILGGNVMLEGTTITACVASASSVGNDDSAYANGGAVFIQDARVTLAHSIISDCTAVTDGESDANAAYGGALHIRGGTMTLDDTTITACAANATEVGNAYGGAVFAVLANTLLTNTTISDCTALVKGGDAWGGAMAIIGGHVKLNLSTITACVANATGLITDKSCDAHGGAMYVLFTVSDGNPLHGSMSLTHTTISDCASTTTAGSGTAFGGAMEIVGQWTVTLDDVTIAACVAASGAGNAYGEVQGQRSSQCGGRCPAGLLCDKVVSVHPRECPLHSYCPEGSSNAIPCPDGDAVIGRSKPTELSRALAFLYEGLNPHVSWWVLFVLARQLVLTGFLALIEPGTLMQLYLGLIVASLSLVIEMHVSPYVDPGNRLLATVSGTSLVLAMIGLLALKMSAFLPDANVANPTKILVLLVVAALAVVGAAVAVFILESRAILAERRSMAVRRLRLQGIDKAVTLAPSAPGRYHVFLSHAWVTGQDQMRVVKQRLLDMLPTVHVFLDVDDAQRRVGKGAEVLNRSDKFLLFASDGFFGGIHAPSRPCMVELLKAVQLGLEMITVLEVEDKHLPLSPSQLYEQMCKLDQPVLDTNGTPVLDAHGQQFPSMYAKWGTYERLGPRAH
ncbi:polymorphic outer membrane protein [Chrysochromulina tobinii]|uniref:Polymorphic outer membrane protein n=1 Tax=Chrysochromulina tobinii TaxID=1460289 RepID=A0A0M0JTC7_9EUKA|nr:polymorphic outer membrane protein [Chrysochromulina tobinii]|eukprot:KOO29834.1 polymorphic outer membrane protein [Chrysochromulina sp. CCMP291]